MKCDLCDRRFDEQEIVWNRGLKHCKDCVAACDKNGKLTKKGLKTLKAILAKEKKEVEA